MGRHDRLIDQLFADKQDRAIARAFVERFEGEPMMADRIEPLLREAARGDAMVRTGTKTREEAQAFLLGFATEALGTPAHIVQSIQDWQPDPSLLPPDAPATDAPTQPEAAPAQAQPVQPTAAAPARPATAAPTREALQQEIARHQANMRAAPGTPEWAAYWKNPAAQAEYRAAVDVMNGVTEPSLAPGTLAGDGAPPAEPAPAA